MSAAHGADATARLAAALSATSLDTIDEATVDLARQRVLDTLGAVVAGREAAAAGVLDTLTADVAGAGRRGPGDGGGLLDDVRGLCAAARASEVDDIEIASCTTAGCVVVPVALLVGAARGAGDRDLLAAVVAGYEAMGRVGTAIDGAHRVYEGVWPSLLAAPVAAAATASRALGLDAPATTHALAIAATRTSGAAGRVAGEPTSRWLTFGCAVADGALAALAAARGLLGDPGVLHTALLRAAGAPDLDALVEDAGDRRIRGVDVKPFCTARQTQSAIEAARDAAGRLEPGGIEAVCVQVPGQYRRMIDRPQVVDRLGSIASAQYQVAAALTDPGALHDVARTRLRGDEGTRELMARIAIEEAPELTALYPRRWPARVRLRRRCGAEATSEVREPLGCAARPLGWEGLRAKHEAIGRWGDALEEGLTRCRAMGDGSHAGTASALLGLVGV